MRIFQTMSIRRKQTLIMMLTSSVALLLACAAFIGFETISFRKDIVQNLSTLAKFIGSNTSAALDFNDPTSAEEMLSALKSQPNIIGACVFSRNGSVFAKYDRPGDNVIFTPPSKSQAAGYSFGKNNLTIFEPIISKGDVIGMIYVESDMRALHTKLAQYAVITVAVFTLTLLVAFLLSARLQRLISEPILDLVQTARAVAQDKNYSIRVAKRSADEIGVLVDSFNEMLAQIQQRDAALQSAQGDLEHRVQERTKELAESQSLYHSLVDQVPAGIFRKNAEGRYVFVNALFCEVTEMPSDEILGKTSSELVASMSAAQTARRPVPDKLGTQGMSHHELIMQTGRQIEVEDEYQGSDGRRSYYHTVKSPVFDADGQIIGSQGILFNITDRKLAEEALRESQALYLSLVDQMPAGIFRKDKEGRFVFVNSWYCELKGVKANRFLGKTPTEVAAFETAVPGAKHPEAMSDTEIAKQGENHHIEILRTGRTIEIEEQYADVDGGVHYLRVVKSPVFDSDGKIVGTQGMLFDITERKRAEESLRLLGSAVEQSKESIVITDAELDLPGPRIIFVNPAFTQMTGYTAAEAIGKTPRILHGPLTDKTVLSRLRQNLERGEVFAGEAINYRKDGTEFNLEWQIAPIRNAGGKTMHFVAIQRDITGRKRLEAQLFQSQKLETVGKLAGGFAHEFNSILTAIIGQSELLLGDLPAHSPLTKSAIEINKAADRAARLTRQLLAYGRKQFLQPEVLNLNRVITGMAGVFHHLMGGAVDVQIVPASGLHSVKADAGQIEQVIMNMAMNAHDAMPNGGKLTLETANVSFDKQSVGGFPELKPGDYVMLAITDTGIGMSEVVKARVFEPFFSTKGVGEGTGLGLSTCYGIIKQSGGHISVYSEPGRGTTFKIYLPQVEPQAKVSIQRLDSPDLPSGTETILLVEDDPALREMAATLLRRLGYTVLAAANGIEALSLKHERSTGHIDLLFTDVVMPHMSGKELADRVRALYPHTRILFTSAYTENAIVHQGVLDKGVALLQKPFTPSALARKVREMLDRSDPPKTDAAQGIFGFTKATDGENTP